MPKLRDNAVPSYRLHKQSGQAVVTLRGKDFLLGPHGSAASRAAYRRLTAEWLANGRVATAIARLTVNELILAFWRHAKTYYRKHGQATTELELIRYALSPLKETYGSTPAADFRPLALQALREQMIARRLSRSTINGHIDRIKRMFKWAVSQELVPADVHHGLAAVSGLKRGRSDAREPAPVRPAPDADVDALISWLSPSLGKVVALQRASDARQHAAAGGGGAAAAPAGDDVRRLVERVPGESPVAAMVYVQRLTGMRSGELVAMRTRDVTPGGDIWVYTPGSHKTEHHERARQIYLGPRVQEVLRPFLLADVDAHVFNPRDATVARWKRMRRLRKSKVQPSQGLPNFPGHG